MVEDSADFALLVAEMLRERFVSIETPHVTTAAEAAEALADPVGFDCVLLDLSLPDATGLEALTQLRAAAPTVPIVVVSGQDDEEVALDAVRSGAQDYLVKNRADPELLSRAVRYAIERMRSEVELTQLALHDPLTGLANRTLLQDRLEHAYARTARSDARIAVLFCDLDEFKLINDSLDHEIGDAVLREVAKRLSEVLRPGDSVARFGGDEFVVLCEDVTEDQATAVAERITEALVAPIEIDGNTLYVTTSIGIATAGPGVAMETLIRNADAAMYRAKQRGGAGHAFHDERVRERVIGRLQLQTDLRRALERRELRVYYQPVVRIDSGEIVGVEALVRWQHPQRGLLEPAQFVPIAEHTGLILPIGNWVLREACHQLAQWRDANNGDRASSLSVNVSARQLIDPALADDVAAALADYDIEPARLCLEITETSVMLDAEQSLVTLRALKALGVALAVDDFGTGHSSLSYLSRLPIDQIKIDRSFMAHDTHARRIVEAIIALAHTLGMTPVAEGVEGYGQVDDLLELGCNYAQGFYFAEPGPPEDAGRLLGHKLPERLARDV